MQWFRKYVLFPCTSLSRIVKEYKKIITINELTNLLPNPVPNASKGSFLKDVGVGNVLVKALELPEAKPEELKVLKGSNAAYKTKLQN